MTIQYSDVKVMIKVSLATICLALTGFVMAGPQILVIAPACLMSSLWCAIRRSSWSWVLFVYPFTFGFTSAWIGYFEILDFWQSFEFYISIGIGFFGCALIALGLCKLINGSNQSQANAI